MSLLVSGLQVKVRGKKRGLKNVTVILLIFLAVAGAAVVRWCPKWSFKKIYNVIYIAMNIFIMLLNKSDHV